jgi:hypothetical protein
VISVRSVAKLCNPSGLQSARPNQFFQSRAEFGDAYRARVAFDPVARRDCVRRGLAFADNQHEWDLLELRVTNLRSDLFAAQVRLDAMAVGLQPPLDLDCLVVEAVRDR